MKRNRKDVANKRHWLPLQRAVVVPKTEAEIQMLVDAARRAAPTLTDEVIRQEITRDAAGSVWRNDRYQVHVNEMGEGWVHLSVRRLDRAPARDWRDLQRIKNQLVGSECEGIELYPAESRLVDAANSFHLWCSTDPDFRFPIGWDAGRLTSDECVAGSVQRPLDDAPVGGTSG